MQSETFQQRGAGEGFSAHLRFDSSGTSSTIGRPTTLTHRGPSFGGGDAGTGGGVGGFAVDAPALRLSQPELDGVYRPSSLSGRSSMLDVDPEEMVRSAGRQHGSFSCLSVLSEEITYPIHGGSVGAGALGGRGPLGGLRGGEGGGGFRGGGGADENKNMAFPFNSRTLAPGDGESSSAAARGVDIQRGAAPNSRAGASAAGGGGGVGRSRESGGGRRASEVRRRWRRPRGCAGRGEGAARA